MLEHMKAPVKALVGPWSHTLPHEPFPERGFEWRARGGALVRPVAEGRGHRGHGGAAPCRVRPRLASPGPERRGDAGHWRYEDGWPMRADVGERMLYLQADHGLAAEQPQAASHQLRYVPDVGIEAAGPVMWWGDLPDDQRAVDAFSLVYDTPPCSRRRDPGLPASACRSPPTRRWRTGSRACPTSRPTARSRWSPAPASTAPTANSAEHPEADGARRPLPSISRCTSPPGSFPKGTAFGSP